MDKKKENNNLTLRQLSLAIAVLSTVFAQIAPAKPQKESGTADQAALQKQAKISMEQARATALKRVPGQIKSEELEREHRRLVYSFDIAVEGKPGITEVQVSAITGKIVSVAHESEKAEASEKKKEGKNE